MSEATRKSKPPPRLSASRDLVSTGPKHVSTKYQGKRDENGERPTTARALILRNGKYSARGTGQVALTTKPSGREKLDLIAEDLVEQSKKALLPPLSLDYCLRIARSQFDACLDDVKNLKDPDLFMHHLEAEFNSRIIPSQSKGQWSSNVPYGMDEIPGVMIHNAYMLASAWKLVVDGLEDLQEKGLGEKHPEIQLKHDAELLTEYLTVYIMVSKLVDAYQNQVSVLATTTPHYAHYFKAKGDEIVFDWEGVRQVCKSFLDSIILELCFPRDTYPKIILFQILRDAVEESPKEDKRFPQALWDAVGDLSNTVDLQTMLERPLLGLDEDLKKPPHSMPEEYEQWVDAQLYSQKALDMPSHWKGMILASLERLNDKNILDDIWKDINLSYKTVSGKDIDELWQLSGLKERKPLWLMAYRPRMYVSDEESDGGGFFSSSQKVIGAGDGFSRQKPLTIQDGTTDDDSDSIPGLKSVSDSEELPEEDSDDEYDDEDDGDYEDEDEYDTDDEEEVREMLREAMDMAAEVPEFYNPEVPSIPEFHEMAETRKGNPFLKLLGSLRGRMFNSNAKLKTADRVEPRGGLSALPPVVQKQYNRAEAEISDRTPKPVPVKRYSKESPTQAAEKSHKATVQEVEDDEEGIQKPKKKKKKPKKKKKSASDPTSTSDQTQPLVVEARPEPATPPPPVPPIRSEASTSTRASTHTRPSTPKTATPTASIPPKTSTPSTPSKTSTPTKTSSPRTATPPKTTTPPKTSTSSTSSVKPTTSKPSTTTASPAKNNGSTTTLPYMSTTSLPSSTEQSAQSARSYIKSQNLDSTKTKVKSRPNFASAFSVLSNKTKKGGGLFSRSTRVDSQDEDEDEEVQKANRRSWFSNLKRRTSEYMHQLLNTSESDAKGSRSMRWEHFEQLMKDMGFEEDKGTAGSSVRFDPPDPRLPSITFHKPHPKTTIHPVKLKEYSKRLREKYGWSEEDFPDL